MKMTLVTNINNAMPSWSKPWFAWNNSFRNIFDTCWTESVKTVVILQGGLKK